MKRIAFVLAAIFVITVPTFASAEFTSRQLASLVAGAKTAAEHQRIANYYRAQADKQLAESNDHARMAAAFRANPATNNDKRVQSTVNHCEYLAKTLRAKSDTARALADDHERMARVAGLR
ncbi:MAG TPA: hypothetical protein VGI45_12025 [Terracidiphilus sp.]|jgi:uncharacterized protein YciW